uniref:Uncharacterized protein n=1 Tax=Heterosigma akashiwo TaxID=2829 RepID=A0A7S3UUA9_HETAK
MDEKPEADEHRPDSKMTVAEQEPLVQPPSNLDGEVKKKIVENEDDWDDWGDESYSFVPLPPQNTKKSAVVSDGASSVQSGNPEAEHPPGKDVEVLNALATK